MDILIATRKSKLAQLQTEIIIKTIYEKHRLTASVDPENKKSIALLEQIGRR